MKKNPNGLAIIISEKAHDGGYKSLKSKDDGSNDEKDSMYEKAGEELLEAISKKDSKALIDILKEIIEACSEEE